MVSTLLPQHIAVIGNYSPRQCGIATFTTDLCDALAGVAPDAQIDALAMNDRPEGYPYPSRVRFELPQNDALAYRRAADFLNLQNPDVVCVQHEYGIFGGAAGSYLLALLEQLRMPVVTTLHTILKEPDAQQRLVLIELARRSERLVVMSERGAGLLHDVYGVPAEKIDLIPHGIPDVPFIDPNFYKDELNAAGKTVILTFGLLSANKGVENVIAAMPAILERHPNVVYVVLGATHPHVRQHEGERYRSMLQAMASSLGVAEHVRFYDQFVALDELVRFIGAADIYVTPYLNEAQITSGTLAYTVGAGKAVISTPYWYAEEMLSEGRGTLVPFRDAPAIANAVIGMLENEAERHAMRKRAYTLGREMTWPVVGQRYMETFARARAERRHSAALLPVHPFNEAPDMLPKVKLDHLRRMTDGTGLIQHATFAVPNYDEGYTTDDNARGLLAAVYMEELDMAESEPLATRYLAFLQHAFNPLHGRFRNFMRYDRHWLEEIGSEDSHARTIWALGATLGRSNNRDLLGMAILLFEQALPAAALFEHPRPCAYAIFGLSEYLRRYPGDRAARATLADLSERLLARYHEHSAPEWHWFDQSVTYDNAVLPHALILAGHALDQDSTLAAGLEALAWLAEVQSDAEGHFAPIGCNGFYPRGGTPARFDQQPLEAQATVAACLAAADITGDEHWHAEARRAFDWFLGHNDLQLSLYDPATGGCHDGLECDRVNQNQGAESTLAFMLALLELTRAEEARATAPLAREFSGFQPLVLARRTGA